MVCTSVTVASPATLPSISNVGFGNAFGRFSGICPSQLLATDIGMDIYVWFDVGNNFAGSLTVRIAWTKDGVAFSKNYQPYVIWGVPSFVHMTETWQAGNYTGLTVTAVSVP